MTQFQLGPNSFQLPNRTQLSILQYVGYTSCFLCDHDVKSFSSTFENVYEQVFLLRLGEMLLAGTDFEINANFRDSLFSPSTVN